MTLGGLSPEPRRRGIEPGSSLASSWHQGVKPTSSLDVEAASRLSWVVDMVVEPVTMIRCVEASSLDVEGNIEASSHDVEP